MLPLLLLLLLLSLNKFVIFCQNEEEVLVSGCETGGCVTLLIGLFAKCDVGVVVTVAVIVVVSGVAVISVVNVAYNCNLEVGSTRSDRARAISKLFCMQNTL